MTVDLFVRVVNIAAKVKIPCCAQKEGTGKRAGLCKVQDCSLMLKATTKDDCKFCGHQ